MNIQRAVVTGGAGFIGSHIVDALHAQGAEVLVIDNLVSGKASNLPAGVRLETVDVIEPQIAAILKNFQPEAVFHLAAQMDVRRSVEDPLFDNRVNVFGSVNVLRSALDAGAQRFVFSSTGGAMYGEVDEIPTPETVPPQPVAPYGISKLCAERYIHYFHANGLPGAVCRFGNVYGPRQDPHGEAGVVAIFGSRLLNGEPCTVFGDGSQVRDYVHVSDVVRACLAAADAPGGTFNIGTGVGTDVNRLYNILAAAAGVDARPVYAEARKGELQTSILNPALAAQKLGWKPSVTVEQGLTAYIEYLRGDQR
ncbi:MAG TPA: NAD-dependent epimerase/dehydratase family protein [Armatimonadota bacterium]